MGVDMLLLQGATGCAEAVRHWQTQAVEAEPTELIHSMSEKKLQDARGPTHPLWHWQ
jgi:hypothetical protein